jgi:hypothetical protein
MKQRQLLHLLSALALAACTKTAGTSDTSDTSGNVPDQDSGTPPDSGEEADKSQSISVEMDKGAIGEDSLFSLTWVDLGSLETAEVIFGKTLVQETIVAQSQNFELRDPFVEELQAVDTETGLVVAAYVGSVQREAEDGSPVFFGLGETWMLFANMAVPSVNLSEGWNFFDPLAEVFSPAATLPVPSNLNPVDVLSISGSYGTESISKERFVMIPLAMENITTEIETIWDSDLPAMWECTLEERPPEDHFLVFTEQDILIAGEIPYSYVDADGSGKYDPNDSLMSKTCSGEYPVMVAFIAEPSTLALAMHFQRSEIKPGWSMIRREKEGKEEEIIFLDKAEYKSLHIGTACEFAEPEPSIR